MRAELPHRLSLAMALGFVLPTLGGAHETGTSRYDYIRHVRPLFERHCASCHRPGGIAPMSLLRYEETAPWVNAIKLAVLERRMPPWLPEEGTGSWRGARGLSAQELDLVVDWASGGAPRGMGLEETVAVPLASSPEPPSDLVVPALRESVLSPDEAERTECVVFPTRLDKDRALVAIEIQPGDERIVRSAVLFHGDTCRARPLATWLPGDSAFETPEGAAEVLRRGASLSARILYKKPWLLDGKTVRDRSRLALRFAKGRRAALAHLDLEAGSSTTFTRGVRIVSVLPRGPRGASLRLDATRPGRGPDPVLAIDRFDPDWTAKYALRSPLELPAGTRLEAHAGGFWIDYGE